jgi:hypothetical protein
MSQPTPGPGSTQRPLHRFWFGLPQSLLDEVPPPPVEGCPPALTGGVPPVVTGGLVMGGVPPVVSGGTLPVPPIATDPSPRVALGSGAVSAVAQWVAASAMATDKSNDGR